MGSDDNAADDKTGSARCSNCQVGDTPLLHKSIRLPTDAVPNIFFAAL